MHISKNKFVKTPTLVIVIIAIFGFCIFLWATSRSSVYNATSEEDIVGASSNVTGANSLSNHQEHPLFQALSNLPRNTSLEESVNHVTIRQRLADETFVVTNLLWVGERLYYREKEIHLSEVSNTPYDFLLIQNPERRVMQFNRERTRQEIFSNLLEQRVMTGLYLSSQTEVDNLVIETILEGFVLTSFYATDNWLYALFAYGAEDKLIWWDGVHLTLAGNFRR